MIGAVDGGGKGAIAVVIVLAMITGKPLLGERVWRTGPVAIVTYEDDELEWHRRIAAACLHYQLDYIAVLKQVHFVRKPGDRLSFAVSVDGDLKFPHSAEIIDRLRDIRAVLLVVDPFNHSHSLQDGNNNVLIARVAAEMALIGSKSGVAVLVLHHLRKGSTGDPDDLMGATSLRATFRSCRILARMVPDAAQKMNIPDPWRYIRIAGSKENYAPPPEKATWFKLLGLPLGNATDEYPEGDDVAVAVTWQPRPMFGDMDGATLRAVFEELRREIYGPTRQAKHTPWVGNALINFGGRSQSEAAKIVRAWLDSGVLSIGEYYHSKTKHTVQRVALDEAKADEILAEIRVVNAPVE